MAVYTFSTKPGSPDDEFVKEIKADAQKKYINFSTLVIEALKDKHKKDKK